MMKKIGKFPIKKAAKEIGFSLEKINMVKDIILVIFDEEDFKVYKKVLGMG